MKRAIMMNTCVTIFIMQYLFYVRSRKVVIKIDLTKKKIRCMINANETCFL